MGSPGGIIWWTVRPVIACAVVSATVTTQASIGAHSHDIAVVRAIGPSDGTAAEVRAPMQNLIYGEIHDHADRGVTRVPTASTAVTGNPTRSDWF